MKGTQWQGYDGPPLPSVRLKVALAGQQLVESLNVLSAAPGWSREAVARAVCAYHEARGFGTTPCSLDEGGFGGLDLNALNYSSFSVQQLGTLRLRVLSTAQLALKSDDAAAVAASRPAVGAIRWDAWYGDVDVSPHKHSSAVAYVAFCRGDLREMHRPFSDRLFVISGNWVVCGGGADPAAVALPAPVFREGGERLEGDHPRKHDSCHGTGARL